VERGAVDRVARRADRGWTRRAVAGTGGGLLGALALGARRGAAQGEGATPGAGPAACPATTPEENKALVEGYWARVWTAGGEAAIPDFLAEDEVHHWGIGGDTVGHDAFADRLRSFLAAFPDFAVRVDHLVAEGDLVVSRWTATATHRGPWQGTPATGQAVEYTGMNLFRIACGKIAEAWGEADHLGLLRQIGAVPEPGATPPAG